MTAVGLAERVAVEAGLRRVPARVGRGRADRRGRASGGDARPRVLGRGGVGSPDAGAVAAGGASLVGPDGVPGRGMPEHAFVPVSAVCHRCFTRLTRLGMSTAEIAAAACLPAEPASRDVGARCRDAGACRRCGTRCCASRTPRSSACGDHRCRWSSSWPTRECGRCRRCPHARWRRAPGRPTARAATATPTTSAGGQRWPPTPRWIPTGGEPGNRAWPSPGR